MKFKLFNGPMPTTASFAAVTTGTSIKTMLQLKPFNAGKITSWGYSVDGFAAALPAKIELIETGTVFGTVTASADVDISKFDGTDQAVASVAGLTLGTSATGYTCTSEGSIVATKPIDVLFGPPTAPYAYQFPLGDQPQLVIGNCYRVRVLFGTAVNMYCWIEVDL